jgi:hypothetical protein
MIVHSKHFFIHKEKVAIIEMKLSIKQLGVVLDGGPLKANSHIPCRSPAVLIHTCNAATLPFSDNVVSFMKVRVVDGNIRTASLLLVTIFVELPVVAGCSRTRTGHPHAVSGRKILIHTYHAVPMPRCAVALRGRFQNGMVVA